jgi:hypothetical protein
VGGAFTEVHWQKRYTQHVSIHPYLCGLHLAVPEK